MKFFDINLYIGTPVKPLFKPVTSAKDLTKMLNNLGIEKALVWHLTQYYYFPSEGNNILSKEIKGYKNLYGSFVILPPHTKEMDLGPKFFKSMKENNIKAIRVFPTRNHYELNKVVFGKFFDEISERRIPVLISMARENHNWSMIYGIMKDFPKLTCILCDMGSWDHTRMYLPLMETYENFYVETSLVCLHEGTLELIVKTYGPERILFGSGFPEIYFESSMLQIIHADIPESFKKKIAYENAVRLISRAEV